jgi:Mg2+-importing ATPase
LEVLRAQLASPLPLVLVAAALISRLLGERVDAAVILGIVVLNAALGFFQEHRAERALRDLRRYVTRTARVRRDGTLAELPAGDLVPGDVIALEVGDLVPADAELLAADALTTDEATLTGESVPVARAAGGVVRAGTAVVSGYGTAVVTATGGATVLGRTAALLARKPEETDFQRNIRRFSAMLVRIIVLLTLFVFAANAFLGKGWFDSFLFAVALAVGITPEVLPVIVTVSLARGALRMARDKVVVKRLMSVEDLGNVDTLCCDKTGTLTRGEFALHDFVAPDGARDPAVLLRGALAGAGESGPPRGAAANPTDRATWASAALQPLEPELAQYRVVDRNVFDFRRRRSSALVAGPGGRALIVKGAAESVLAACTQTATRDGIAPLTAEQARIGAAMVAGYEEQGFRVLAVADRPLDAAAADEADERDLTLRGFLLYYDPPKSDVRAALEALGRLGIAIKIVSGDSAVVTRRICREVGMEAGTVVEGEELARCDDAALRRLARERSVFARVAPEQKQRLVAALRSERHVVGFLGDGVNDAPALRAADVGLAVDAGTEVAKDAADVVLLQKSLAVLAGGIVEGRKTFANITKYILNTVSANFGNMATVAVSSVLLRFIPLLPSQILLNNFLSDLPLVTIATDRVDPGLLHRPRRWNVPAIARFMMLFGMLSVVFDLVLITVLRLAWHADAALFRTAWFVESAASEMLVTFAIRTRLPFLRSVPSAWLAASSAAAVALAFALPYTGLGQEHFRFVPLPPRVLLLVAGVLAAYFASAEMAKRPFFRRVDL